ncbi:hypothetical protein [uncultured Bacteroides sp.]|uniref:hypothetical protein n=1 Tax=uncultured Bacteroides sp. TaxID=162156 RepID=UPI002AA83C05|nr:hypothetical protein [uncultured Bacteroides sp.]
MIGIQRFREILVEISSQANAELEDKIDKCVLAVKEDHLQKKITDMPGVVLCANFPDAEMQREHADKYSEDNIILLMLLEKVNAGEQTEEQELQHYAKMQTIIQKIKEIIGQRYFNCDELRTGHKIRTEWEYNVYGGFNGLSIALTLEDYD